MISLFSITELFSPTLLLLSFVSFFVLIFFGKIFSPAAVRPPKQEKIEKKTNKKVEKEEEKKKKVSHLYIQK